MGLREDKSIIKQRDNLIKKLSKVENKYEKAGPAKKPRLVKEAELVLKKLESIQVLLK